MEQLFKSDLLVYVMTIALTIGVFYLVREVIREIRGIIEYHDPD